MRPMARQPTRRLLRRRARGPSEPDRLRPDVGRRPGHGAGRPPVVDGRGDREGRLRLVSRCDQLLSQLAIAGLEPVATVFGTPASTHPRSPTRRPTTRRPSTPGPTSSAPPRRVTGPTATSGRSSPTANPGDDAAADPRVGDLERAELVDLLVPDPRSRRLRRPGQAVGQRSRRGRPRGRADERRDVRDPAVGRRDRLLRLHRVTSSDTAASTTRRHRRRASLRPRRRRGHRVRSRTPARRSTTPAATRRCGSTEIGWGSNPKSGNDLVQDARGAGRAADGELSDRSTTRARNGASTGSSGTRGTTRPRPPSASAAGARRRASSTPTATASRPGSPSRT